MAGAREKISTRLDERAVDAPIAAPAAERATPPLDGE